MIDARYRAMVSDFGMSKLLSEGGFATSKEPGGSVPWMAPELFTDNEATHTRESDVWSFGMTILVCFGLYWNCPLIDVL